MSRGFKITRSDYSDKDSSDRVGWLDDFASKLELISNSPKSAVEVARSRNQQSILDQISQIVSRKTVTTKSFESAVQELQERVGLKEYIKRFSSTTDKATQPQHKNDLHKVFQGFPEDLIENIENFIFNKIEGTHHGHIQVPAIVEDVKNTFKEVQPHHVNDFTFQNYVNNVILESQKRNPEKKENNHNIGRGVGLSDESTTNNNGGGDFFEGIMTARK